MVVGHREEGTGFSNSLTECEERGERLVNYTKMADLKLEDGDIILWAGEGTKRMHNEQTPLINSSVY